MKIRCKILLILIFSVVLLFEKSFCFCFSDYSCIINGKECTITELPVLSGYSNYLFIHLENYPLVYLLPDGSDISNMTCQDYPVYSGSGTFVGLEFPANTVRYAYFPGSGWVVQSDVGRAIFGLNGVVSSYFESSFGIYYKDELINPSVVTPEPGELKKPFITNSNTVLSTGNFDYLCINSGDFHDEKWQDFYLMCYDYSSDDSIENIYPRKIIKIDGGIRNKYYTNTYDNSYIFMIPLSDLSLSFKNNCNYGFKLATGEYVDFEGQQLLTYDYFFGIKFSVSGLAAEDLFQNSIDNMNSSIEENTNVIKEQTEVNKNIFEKIGEILSYLNPFSENFFAYKLISLLLDGLKSLFIPSNDFFSTFFTDLKEWFSDRLGFLFYPFELIIDILNKIMNINFSEPVFEIPDINEPFTNSKLISATSYNLNDLLKNSIFKTVHNIYLLCVDAFIVFGLVNLAKRKFEEVTNK